MGWALAIVPPAQYAFGGKEILSQETTTDANGNVSLRLPANIMQEDRSQIYVIEATVMDSSNQPVSGQAAVVIHRGTVLHRGAAGKLGGDGR